MGSVAKPSISPRPLSARFKLPLFFALSRNLLVSPSVPSPQQGPAFSSSSYSATYSADTRLQGSTSSCIAAAHMLPPNPYVRWAASLRKLRYRHRSLTDVMIAIRSWELCPHLLPQQSL